MPNEIMNTHSISKSIADAPSHARPLRVTVWNEYRQERSEAAVATLYPRGVHAPIVERLVEEGMLVTTATLDQPQHGLDAATLEATDVLIWWGHRAHHLVDDRVVERAQQRVLDGMGLVVLHSAHFSKLFCALMGTSCRLQHRVDGGRERIWCVAPAHPIAADLPPLITLAQEEMYGEHFDVPPPDELVFISSFESGEVFRSGCVWRRGRGRVFYWRPGHETYPSYHDPLVLQVIVNAVRWLGTAAP